jgi:hypothetical protein
LVEEMVEADLAVVRNEEERREGMTESSTRTDAQMTPQT